MCTDLTAAGLFDTCASLFLVHISNYSIYCPYWVIVRSMSVPLYRLFTLSGRAWISLPSSTEIIVCDWQQHDANACSVLRISLLQHIFKPINQSLQVKKKVAPSTENWKTSENNISLRQSTTHTLTSTSFILPLFLKCSCFLPLTYFPFIERVSVTIPSLLPSLSALLLLVPLVAATVCVLLWRWKHISARGESSDVFFFDSFSCPVHLWPLSAAVEWCEPWHPLGLL